MVKASIVAADIHDFYRQIVAAQEAAHGPNYCDHHDLIREAAKDGASSYAELGTNQGATLACALLAGFPKVWGVDIAPENFRPYRRLFEAFPAFHDVLVQDSRLPFACDVDFLLVDSVHTVAHLREELAVHGPNVKRSILIHDTAKYPDLDLEAYRFCTDSRGHWTVYQSNRCGYGHTLLARVP